MSHPNPPRIDANMTGTPKRKQRVHPFTIEEKKTIVRKRIENGWSWRKTGEEFDCDPSCARRWSLLYENDIDYGKLKVSFIYDPNNQSLLRQEEKFRIMKSKVGSWRHLRTRRYFAWGSSLKIWRSFVLQNFPHSIKIAMINRMGKKDPSVYQKRSKLKKLNAGSVICYLETTSP